MGCAVRVDGDRVTAAAARLTEVVQELTAAGEAMVRVLQTVADVGGGAALEQAAGGAVRQWSSGMGRVVGYGEQLTAATAAAATSYLAVEELGARRWSSAAPARPGSLP